MSDTELIDPAVLESLPEQPEPPQDGLNRLQKKMLKFFLFGEGSLNGRGDFQLRLRAFYRMVEAGVFNTGISFDESRDRMDEWNAKLEQTGKDWCSEGERNFKDSMKHKEPPKPPPPVEPESDVEFIERYRREYETAPAGCSCENCRRYARLMVT